MYGSTHVKVQRTSVKRIGSALSHLVRHDDSDLEDKEEESEDDDVAACMWICVSVSLSLTLDPVLARSCPCSPLSRASSQSSGHFLSRRETHHRKNKN